MDHEQEVCPAPHPPTPDVSQAMQLVSRPLFLQLQLRLLSGVPSVPRMLLTVGRGIGWEFDAWGWGGQDHSLDLIRTMFVFSMASPRRG